MYNQPFSQPPGMFGAQSAMAQMQSAPSQPAGNPRAREYYNYSMAALSEAVENAAMPQAMMPQGISSLVPQYQFGGDVGYSGDVNIDWGSVAAAMDAAQAQADAAAAADAAADAAAVDSITQPSVQSDVGIPATSAPAPGFDPGTSYDTSNPKSESLVESALNFLDNYAMPSNRGPGLVLSGALGPFGFVPGLVTGIADALGLKAGDFYGGQGGFDSDLAGLSTPSFDDIIDQMTPPDTGDNIDPDLGDPQQAAPAAPAVAPAYVPPVYQTYAGLGLPSVSPIPPLRRVTVPISSFVV